MTDIGSMTIRSTPDGPVVEQADAWIRISQDLLDDADERWLVVVPGESVTVHASNGSWTYDLTEFDPLLGYWLAHLVEAPDAA